MTSTTTTVPATGSRSRRLPLAVVAAAVPSAVVAAAIALAAPALGVPSIPQLTPAAVALFALLGAAAAVLGWAVVRRRATRPRRLLGRLVPVLTVLSLVPDVLLGALLAADPGVGPAVLLGTMHLATVAIVVLVASRLLPVGRDPHRA